MLDANQPLPPPEPNAWGEYGDGHRSESAFAAERAWRARERTSPLCFFSRSRPLILTISAVLAHPVPFAAHQRLAHHTSMTRVGLFAAAALLLASLAHGELIQGVPRRASRLGRLQAPQRCAASAPCRPALLPCPVLWSVAPPEAVGAAGCGPAHSYPKRGQVPYTRRLPPSTPPQPAPLTSTPPSMPDVQVRRPRFRPGGWRAPPRRRRAARSS